MIVSVIERESQVWPILDIRVRLNGKDQKYCTYADDELGYIIVYDVDEAGSLVLRRDDVVKKVLLGAVEIFVGDSFK